MVFSYSIVFTIFVIVFCNPFPALPQVENFDRSDILPFLDNIKDEKEFGLLHTLSKYSEWSEKEEIFQIIFASRLNILHLERKSIKGFNMPKFTNRFESYDKKTSIFNEHELSRMINIDRQEWVGSEDLLMSMTGIAYLQKVYLIPGEQMLIGLPVESKFGGFLSQLDCVIQSLCSLMHKNYATTVDWLQTALEHVSGKISLDWISIMFSIGIQAHNFKLSIKTYQSAKISGENYNDVYDMPILNGQLPPYQYSKRKMNFNTRRGVDVNARFTDLCQGNNLQSSQQKSKLYCYFETKKHPYLYINPVKVEHLSKDPPILQFYEIMSNSSMETIQREIGSHVKSFNLFFDKNNVAEKNSPVRITNSARMGIRNFAKVSNATYYLTGILSGLNILDHANHNVLGEHVYGRHFNIHNDGVYTARSNEAPEDEDTIATMLFYLKLPAKGGCTAFIHAGICSRKVTGSALFWYNMYRNGTYTTRLTHGSCPVYHGNKIAISFFFQHNANWNRRLCTVNQLE